MGEYCNILDSFAWKFIIAFQFPESSISSDTHSLFLTHVKHI